MNHRTTFVSIEYTRDSFYTKYIRKSTAGALNILEVT